MSAAIRWALPLALALTQPLVRADDAAPPAPELRVPAPDVREADADALAPEDPRRAALLADLAVRRHAEADALERDEQAAHQQAMARWREAPGDPGGAARLPPPALATPRADALRAQVVRLAERVMEEAPGAPELADALMVAGLDAERIGRSRDALRMLGLLIRRFPTSALAPHAWLALGEHHLRAGELTRARVAFDQAERRGAAPVRAWAAKRLAELTTLAERWEVDRSTGPERKPAATRRR